MSLRMKLFAAFFVFIIVPLCAIGVSAYIFISSMIEDKYAQQAEISLRAMSQTARFIFLEMDKVTDSTIAMNAIQEVLNTPLYLEQDVTEINYLALNEVQQKFRELLVYHPSVSFGFMYMLDNERIIRLYAKDKFTAMPFAEFKEMALYRNVMERKGAPVWVGPFEFPELTGYEHVFTQIRIVKDIDTLQDRGILLVQIKHSGLEDIFRYYQFNREKYDTRFLLVNASGLILFDSSEGAAGQSLADHMGKPPRFFDRFQSHRVMFGETDSVMSSIPLGHENWQLVSLTSWSSLSREIVQYVRWVIGIMSLCVVLALVFLLFSVNRIARAIVRIVRLMRRVEDGEMNIRVLESGDNDEIRLLNRGFNSLIERVQLLISRVKQEQQQKMKAEMRVLQAQIKPHFMFNTLESINALAVQNEGKKVSRMVHRLAAILRISFQEQERISIRQELEHLQHYLDIQTFRFAELFDYEIDVPEQLMNMSILKLTLQPLVENSIQHGFEGIEYKGKIRIEGRREKERVILIVQDNGVGMDSNALSRFQYLMPEPVHSSEYTPHPNVERRGLGIRSVADRLRIEYGEKYGLFICSEPGAGTTFRCVIPASASDD